MTANLTVRDALNEAHPGNFLDLLRKRRQTSASVNPWGFGDFLAGKKSTVTGATASASITLSPPALTGTVQLRITAGAAAAGPRQISDVGATLSATVARLSDDGTTLTIEDTCTGYVVSYVPRLTDAELAALAYPTT
jgi:hypothetical protein